MVDFEIEDNCYVNDKIIGTTVSKKITVNILNPDNNINLENKEVIVNAGIVIDGEMELVPFGNFIIEKPTNQETKQNTKFVGYDYMIKFNKKYEDTLTYPITLKEYLKNLCGQVGIELGSSELTNGDYKIQGNPFTNNEDCKTVLSNVAQLCGGFAHIGRDNKLYIINLGGEIQETIDGNNYFTLEKNDQYGEVNSLIIRLSQVEGENTTKEDTASINMNGLTEITIADNYFLNSAEEREKVIDEIFIKINGLKYIPINCSYYGYPYLDVGDAITLLDTKDVEYSTYILNHKFKYNGGFSGNIEATALTKTQTAYKNNVDLKTKFQNVEFKVDKINGSITQVINNVTDQNQKISEVTQTVNELNSKISDIADITTSKESTNGTLDFEKINQSEPIYVKIYPTGENISYLYPHANLFPSETLYLKVRTLRFTNTTTKEIFDYELPTDLLYHDAENYDEFILDYDAQSCEVNKRVGYNADGTTYVLENPTTKKYEYPRIELTDGDYVITLLGYHNAYIFVRLMAQNMYTTQWATKAELNSEISQTVSGIDLSVNKKLSNYSTTSQMNSAINLKVNEITSTVNEKFKNYSTTSQMNSAITQKANEITSSVSETYETKSNATTNYSKLTQTANSLQSQISANDKDISSIKQTATSLQSQITSNDTDISTIKQSVNEVNIEVGKKYNTSDFTNAKITAKINDGTSNVKISADKISLVGKTINLTSDNTVIKSTNFNVDKNGNMSCNNASFKGGEIKLEADGSNRFVIGDEKDRYGEFTRMNGREIEIWNKAICQILFDTLNEQMYIASNSSGTRTGTYIYPTGITTPKVTQASKESKKKNITKYNEKALDIVKDSEIYTYNFKGEQDQDKKHIGFVIGDEGGEYKTPEQVISNDREGIESYSMTSILWKAFQEYIEEKDEQIKQLQNEIKELKKESEK